MHAQDPVPCDSCGAPGCDPECDRCGCDKIICSRCMDDDRLWHFRGGAHKLLKSVNQYEARAIVAGFAILALADRTKRFQERFKNQPIEAKCEHLKREAAELRDAPSDIVENADCLILTLGINASNGRSIEHLLDAAHEKLTVCESRKWGKSDKFGVFHHIEEKP